MNHRTVETSQTKEWQDYYEYYEQQVEEQYAREQQRSIKIANQIARNEIVEKYNAKLEARRFLERQREEKRFRDQADLESKRNDAPFTDDFFSAFGRSHR